jgi:stage V sporulation protein SpoVS
LDDAISSSTDWNANFVTDVAPPAHVVMSADAERLEAATDEAIAACGGDARQAVKALIVANEFLEAQLRELQAAVSNAMRVASLNPCRPTVRTGTIE